MDFAKRGAKVILACRDENKAKEAVNKIKNQTHNSDVLYKLVDLSSFKSVRQFAEDINANEERLDILVNNAGAGGLGDKITEDGLPIVMQINYFSHFLLTNLLLGECICLYFQNFVLLITLLVLNNHSEYAVGTLHFLKLPIDI